MNEHPDETYRNRWLTVFCATYSSVAVVSTGFIAFAALLWTDGIRETLIALVCISIIQLFLIVSLFWILREMYEKLAYWTPQFESEEEYDAEYRKQIQWANERKKVRRLLEMAIHILMVVQAALVAYAFYQTK